MSATPINLNKARKARARRRAKARADENAVKFGRSRAEKLRDANISETLNRHLDGSKRDE